ncbi:PIN domain-containing protein [Candidatus Kaiserbacteria bacterium]|nr:PIN domain-containing protein [Candidatus Kaiserbacteria bacterium]
MRSRVFLDSSVVIAALLSREGGSYHVLSRFSDAFVFEINEYVFEEVRRSKERKFASKPALLSNLFSIIALADITIVPNPDKEIVRIAGAAISKKDAPVLASALLGSGFLLTLDNEFFLPTVTALAKERDILILKPGDFIRRLGL